VEPGRAGEVAGAFGIDPGVGHAGSLERPPQARVVPPGRLEVGRPTPSGEIGGQRQDRLLAVGDPVEPGLGIENVEIMFGNVDADVNKGYHGTCPCGARSGCKAASCNCSGWTRGTRAGIRPDNGVMHRGSNDLPPAPIKARLRHTGIQRSNAPRSGSFLP
jgi:hypothetical protein